MRTPTAQQLELRRQRELRRTRPFAPGYRTLDALLLTLALCFLSLPIGLLVLGATGNLF